MQAFSNHCSQREEKRGLSTALCTWISVSHSQNVYVSYLSFCDDVVFNLLPVSVTTFVR